MPVHKQGSGYQWGSHGKIYTGAHARQRAEAQGKAAYANGYREPGKAVKTEKKARKLLGG